MWLFFLPVFKTVLDALELLLKQIIDINLLSEPLDDVTQNEAKNLLVLKS